MEHTIDDRGDFRGRFHEGKSGTFSHEKKYLSHRARKILNLMGSALGRDAPDAARQS